MISEKRKWLGDCTEVALIQFALDKNLNRGYLKLAFTRAAQLPFNSKRKGMTIKYQTQKNDIEIIDNTKGAFDVFNFCGIKHYFLGGENR